MTFLSPYSQIQWEFFAKFEMKICFRVLYNLVFAENQQFDAAQTGAFDGGAKLAENKSNSSARLNAIVRGLYIVHHSVQFLFYESALWQRCKYWSALVIYRARICLLQ